MKISDRNFLASQCFYGLAIAKQIELPSITTSDVAWDAALDRLVDLSFRTADKMLKHRKEEIR